MVNYTGMSSRTKENQVAEKRDPLTKLFTGPSPSFVFVHQTASFPVIYLIEFTHPGCTTLPGILLQHVTCLHMRKL